MHKKEKPDFRTASLFVVLLTITILFVLGARLVLNVPSVKTSGANPVTAGFLDDAHKPASSP